MIRYALVAGGVALALLAIFHSAPRPPQSLAASASSPSPDASASRRSSGAARATIVVYVAGAVRRPGLYRVSSDARADDAVRRAGGLTSTADA
ncbi:MAG TPA: SLBB domain-containing protein, partial [Candidatus Tyrphobacter sp.]